MTKFKVIENLQEMAIWAKKPYFWPPGVQKGVKMNFWKKNENVTLSCSLILSYMQKIRKIYRADFRENWGRHRERQTERETDRDGPEYKGPPDAIAKPSDQKKKIGQNSSKKGSPTPWQVHISNFPRVTTIYLSTRMTVSYTHLTLPTKA